MKAATGDALRAEINSLQTVIAGLQEAAETNARSRSEAILARNEAIRERDETREHFADLKERLHTAELENARLKGYMDRVREDDHVADPLVEVEGPEGKRFVTKRHPTPHMPYIPPVDYNAVGREMWQERKKRKHWTSY